MDMTWQEILQEIWKYLNESGTMAVTSLLFLVFFAVVALIHYALPRVVRPYFLLAASYAFFCYEETNRPLVWVLIVTTAVTWLCGLIIGRSKIRAIRVIFMLVSVFGGIGVLVYYKYWNMLADMTGGSILSSRENVLAPLGLSYFTFAAMSYAIDVYKHRCKVETNPFHYALFVGFFPTLTTGPIERYPQIRPQIQKSRRFSYSRCAGGAFRMLWGYTKKLVIADNLSIYVSTVFGDAAGVGGPNIFAASILFAIQLYMDFSGCCDIALGAARILGFDLIENFALPFESRSFSDFWRRWHISMTSWFRDYVYFPLGGSHCPPWRHYLNIVIVFVCSGLWHGADWRYLAWGLACGIVSAFGTMTAKKRHNFNRYNPLYRIPWFCALWQCAITNLLFCLTLVFFASALYNANPFTVYAALFSGWHGILPAWYDVLGLASACGIDGRLPVVLIFSTAVVFSAEHNGQNIARWIRAQVWPLRWCLYYAAAASILFFAAFGQSAFIYQQY